MFSFFLQFQTLVSLYQLARTIFNTARLPLNTNSIPYDIDSDSEMAELPESVVYSFAGTYVGETITDSESEYDEDEEYTDIEHVETAFQETDKIDGRYYIGIPFLFRIIDRWVLNCSVSAPTFLGHPVSRVRAYLQTMADFYISPDSAIEIVQLHITDYGEHTVVVKTFWLRIIQRRWRNVLRDRDRVFAKRASVQNQEYFRTHGRYLPGTKHIPGLRGLFVPHPSR